MCESHLTTNTGTGEIYTDVCGLTTQLSQLQDTFEVSLNSGSLSRFLRAVMQPPSRPSGSLLFILQISAQEPVPPGSPS